MKIIRILDSTGDRVLTFDDANVLARGEAKALFEQTLAGGAIAFKVNRGHDKPDVKAMDFSTLENETILVPRIVGG
jgi:hypothetical protein